MIRTLILATVALVSLSAFTPEAEARRNRAVVVKPGKAVIVKPARRVVVVKPVCPSRDAVWVAGHWEWCGPRLGYRWAVGHWSVR